MKKLIAIYLALVVSGFPGTAVFFDPNSAGATNRVTAIRDSEPPEKYVGASNVVVLNERSDILTNSPSLLKWDGAQVVLLTQTELDAISAAQAAAQATAIASGEREAKTNAIAAVDAYHIDGRLLRAMAEITMDEINILRVQVQMARTNTLAFQAATNISSVTLAPRTLSQLQTGIRNKITAQSDTKP